jgi:hypothetical protein
VWERQREEEGEREREVKRCYIIRSSNVLTSASTISNKLCQSHSSPFTAEHRLTVAANAINFPIGILSTFTLMEWSAGSGTVTDRDRHDKWQSLP